MLLLIVLIAIAVVGITACVLLDKYTWLDALSIVFGAAGVGALTIVFVLASTLINLNRRFDAQINRYEVIAAMVESYDGQEYGNMPALTEAVVNINTVIAKHKAYCGNVWTGIWYSEDIAKLEPIKFGKKTVLKE